MVDRASILCRSSLSDPFKHESVLYWSALLGGTPFSSSQPNRRIAHSFSQPLLCPPHPLSLPPSGLLIAVSLPVPEQNVFMAAALADGLLTHYNEEPSRSRLVAVLCCGEAAQHDALVFPILKCAPVRLEQAWAN